MAQLPQNYVPENTQEQAGFDPVPAGDYPAVAIDSEVKDTKNGTGQYLQVTFEVIEGEYKGRKLWGRYNLVNQNKQAEEIGHAQLKQLSVAAGKPNARDSSELHNIPVILKVTMRNDEQYGAQNDIKEVKTYQAGGAPAAATASSEKPSWAGK